MTETLRRWTGPIAAAALLLVGWLAVVLVAPPALPDAPPPEAAFSAERAWRHIEEVARAPHPPGTPEHDRVRSYLIAELGALGLQTIDLATPEDS